MNMLYAVRQKATSTSPPKAFPATMNATMQISAMMLAAIGMRRYFSCVLRSAAYCSIGICRVFQLRPHFGHVQRSPYATYVVSPHSQVSVILGPRRTDRG